MASATKPLRQTGEKGVISLMRGKRNADGDYPKVSPAPG
jgi:hypothetical protein